MPETSDVVRRTPHNVYARTGLLIPSRFELDKLASVCLVLVLAVAFAMPVVRWVPLMLWHDQQRVAQVVIVLVVAVFAVLALRARPQLAGMTPGLRTAIVVMGALGAVSATQARMPLWAFTELALMVGCLGIAWMAAVGRTYLRERFDRMLLWSLFAVCMAITVRALFNYVMALQASAPQINPWQVLTGFSHLRFLGQFASLSLPLLAVPLLLSSLSRWQQLAVVLVLVLWWTVAISSGTRGTWLGMAVAMAVMALAGRGGRGWAATQVLAVAGALALYMVWMHWLPEWLGVATTHTADERLTTSLSGRGELWTRAAQLMMAHPLLGAGPMHGADYLNRGPTQVIGHPHQSWLQWASEWGVPSALLLTTLVARGLWAALRTVARHERLMDLGAALAVGLTGAVLATLTQAMVDGVLVMPYTQLWLALVGGWLFAVHARAGDAFAHSSPRGGGAQGVRAASGWLFIWVLVLCLACALLMHVVTRDIARMDTRSLSYHRPYGQVPSPRFWAQGVIGVPVGGPNTSTHGAEGSAATLSAQP